MAMHDHTLLALYGWPIAAGGRDRPMTPATTMIVST